MNSKYWDLDDHKPAQIVANIFSLLSRLTIFFSNPYKIERDFEFSGLACQWSPYSSYSFTRNLQRWIKVRSFVIPVYVNLLSTFWCFCGLFWRYTSVFSLHCGVIPARIFRYHSFFFFFRYHSCPFHFIPPSFRHVAVYSGTILVHSVSFHRVLVYSGIFHSVPVYSNALYKYVRQD